MKYMKLYEDQNNKQDQDILFTPSGEIITIPYQTWKNILYRDEIIISDEIHELIQLNPKRNKNVSYWTIRDTKRNTFYSVIKQIEINKSKHSQFFNCLKKRYMAFNWSKLERVDCYQANISSLKGIEELTNLKILTIPNITRNKINLDSISNLDLEILYCGFNKLTSIKQVEHMTNLKILSCSNNKITNLNVKNLVNLEYLYCNNNQLTEIKGIKNLTKLKSLSCRNNLFSADYKKYLSTLKIVLEI